MVANFYSKGRMVAQSGLMLMVSFSIYSFAGEDKFPPKNIKKMQTQLARLETYLQELRTSEKHYNSIETYLIADDIEVAINDARSELSRLNTARAPASETDKIADNITLKLNAIEGGLVRAMGPSGQIALVTQD